MKKSILLCALAVLLALGGQAFAELNTIDVVPAATLLIPYFAVDISDDACANRDQLTTLFSVNNASAAPQVAHVTIWTDWSVPSLDFDIYLTGYDVQTINIRDIFCDGVLPQTGSAISNVGLFSAPNVAFPGCNNTDVPGEGPNYLNPFSNLLIDQLKTWHTGQPGAGTGDCAGEDHGDSIARGYITIDNVDQCSLQFPSSPGYFTDIANTTNALWGDYAYADFANNFSQGFTSVHIEADDTAFAPGDHTFYGRYVAAAATDGREALPTTMGGRFALGGAFDGTSHQLWREGDASFNAVACGTEPLWWPLGFANQSNGGAVIVFDEQENPFVPEVQPGPSNPLPPDEINVDIPNETNSVAVGGPGLDTGGFNFGWIYYNLQSEATDTTYGDDLAQGWLTVVMQASGRFSVGWDGIQFDNANNAIVTNPGPVVVPTR